MVTQAINRLSYLLDTIPALIKAIPEEEFSRKPSEQKWSGKQILGHLIDSAANNHQRFVRIPFENTPFIVYDQDNWNKYSYHQQASGHDIVHYWEMYNKHLLFIISHIHDGDLYKTCLTNGPEPVTLEWLIVDYVDHMEHHLRQIVDYE